jgi:hypothetical protein
VGLDRPLGVVSYLTPECFGETFRQALRAEFALCQIAHTAAVEDAQPDIPDSALPSARALIEKEFEENDRECEFAEIEGVCEKKRRLGKAIRRRLRFINSVHSLKRSESSICCNWSRQGSNSPSLK